MLTKKEASLSFFDPTDTKNVVKCKICANTVSISGDASLSNLIRHLRAHTLVCIEGKRFPQVWEDLVSSLSSSSRKDSKARIQRILELLARREPKRTSQTKLKLVAQPELNAQRGISLDNLELSDVEYQCFQFLGIILRNQPFSSVEDGFEQVSRKLHFLHTKSTFGSDSRPAPAPFSRTHCTNQFLPILAEAATLHTKHQLKETTLGSTLTDGWSSVHRNRYIGLCYQFVNWQSLRVECQVLLFESFQASHTSSNLAHSYGLALDQYLGLNCVIANHTTDNAPNEKHSAALLLEQKGFWKDGASCMAHTIQLDLENFFPLVASVLLPILKYNSRLLNSPSLRAKFLKHQTKHGCLPLEPCSTVKTRWWSMIPALSFYVRRRDSIVRFAGKHMPDLLSKLSQKKKILIFEPPSFQLAKELLAYLEKLEQIQSRLSSEKNVTSTKVLSVVSEIKQLQPPCQAQCSFPRLTGIYEKLTIWSKAAFFDPDGIRHLDHLKLVETVKSQLIHDLQRLTVASSSNPFDDDLDYRKVLDVVETQLRQQPVEHFRCLQYYSETILPLLSQKSQEKARALQNLLSLLFSVPATQVACERLFSKASQVAASKKGSLGHTTLSDLVCIQKAFPNTVDGVLKALNAVRDLGNEAHRQASSSDQ